jgi:small-conductance mechanosensitive channel
MNKGRITHELNRTIYEKFNARGIAIPFPQRDVHIREVKG